MANIPSDAPPSYEQAAASSSSHPERETRNGIPPQRRRSMEDEHRPLPSGWVRQYDAQTHHQFFVDTNTEPPRSIWSHPYDDEQYLKSLSPEERQHINRLHKSVSLADIEAESSDDEVSRHRTEKGAELPPRPGPSSDEPHGIHKFGRKIKDKITSSTHQEREISRQRRAQEEQQQYQQHMAFRQAMSRAIQTGQPQLVGKDRQGRDIYIEPPNGPAAPHGAYGYNPYAAGPYASPNSRFVRPSYPYQRPYGYGYGAGYGFPLLAGGLLGGALLGGALF